MGDCPATDGSDAPTLRRELLKAAIADIQGSVHANDSKCSAALVVHGLLFAGVVTVVSRLGKTWMDADGMTQCASKVLLGIATVCFVLSIGSLLWGLLPYSPKQSFIRPIDQAHRPPGVFFPDLDALTREGADAMTPYLAQLAVITTPAVLERELAFEVLKVQDIRRHEARYATFGFKLLFAEIFFATAFLVVMGVEAA